MRRTSDGPRPIGRGLAVLLSLLIVVGASGLSVPGPGPAYGVRIVSTGKSARERAGWFSFLAALGLGAGVVASIVYRRVDPRLKRPDQVPQELRVAILGAIPDLGTAGRLRAVATARTGEGVRQICSGVRFQCGDEGGHVIAVASPEPSGGATFVAHRLALGFAEFGLRTLLVDGDLRRGQLHRLVGCRLGPGLNDILTGRADVDEAIQQTSHPYVGLIGRGTALWRSMGGTGAPALSRLLDELRPRYDCIFLDSPPLTAGIESLTNVVVAGKLILVLRHARTDRGGAGAGIEGLGTLPVKVLGAVLNGVPGRGAYRYHAFPYASEYGTIDDD